MPARRVAVVTSIALLGACARPQVGGIGGGGGGGPTTLPSEPCVLSTGEVTSRPSTITVGLTDAVDPRHAPAPRTDAERIVFRHLYETPLRFDCDGHAHAELAEKWAKDDDGRRWTFRLRDGAQFWDGVPVTAEDVVFGKGGVGYTVGALETRVVTVTFAKEQDDVPPLLADPGLALTKPAPD